MGIRCTQLIGLPPTAKAFLKESGEQVVTQRCSRCGAKLATAIHRVWYDSAKHDGMFDDGPDLYMYWLKDGRRVMERVQSVSWSSGPMIFLELVDSQGSPLFAWTEEEMEKSL